MISAYAKSKVSVREADFAIAAVSKEKVAIVGKSKKFKVIKGFQKYQSFQMLF